MGEEGLSRSEDEESRREEGKRIADALRAEYRALGNPSGWFDACYKAAEGDPFLLPWGHQVARPELVEWVERLPVERRTGRALDIACGLGDNAALLARAGFDVTAFDISETAVEWAASRFPDLAIDWRAADLLEPLEEWGGAFDLVNETYTLQALRPPNRERAIGLLSGFLAPGGTLLIIGRGRHPDEPENPPPWPLLRAELEPLKGPGLEEVAFEDFLADRNGRKVRHFRVEYRRT
jgi:SAM-dependent methyltransferase